MKACRSILQAVISIAIVIGFVVALPASTALASTAGPLDAGAGSNGTGIGTEPWQNPANITSPGTPYATVALYHSHLNSNYLQGSHYGFAIPTNATILGIEVSITRMASGMNPSIHDAEVRLMKAGSFVGDNKSTGLDWPLSFSTTTFGSSTDLWGTTWTPAEVNSPDFGVALAALRDNNGNNNRTASVDTMKITVYYQEAAITGYHYYFPIISKQ